MNGSEALIHVALAAAIFLVVAVFFGDAVGSVGETQAATMKPSTTASHVIIEGGFRE